MQTIEEQARKAHKWALWGGCLIEIVTTKLFVHTALTMYISISLIALHYTPICFPRVNTNGKAS